MSPRVVETLQQVDVIAAEDTRNSIKLLNHFEIHTPMTSYHEYNKVEKAKQLVRQMLDGQNIALITDAGTPAISDPGEVLVRMCQENGVCVTSLPGAAACITALTLSGLNTRRFCFEALGNRKITLCRELTKKFEEVLPTTLDQVLEVFREREPRGEYVLVVEGKSFAEKKKEKIASWETMTIEEHMAYYEEQGMERKEAMKAVAKDRGVGKREIYQALCGE